MYRSGRDVGSRCSSTTAGCYRGIRRIYHAFNPQGVGIIAARAEWTGGQNLSVHAHHDTI
jgi:hypothetical protein